MGTTTGRGGLYFARTERRCMLAVLLAAGSLSLASRTNFPAYILTVMLIFGLLTREQIKAFPLL